MENTVIPLCHRIMHLEVKVPFFIRNLKRIFLQKRLYIDNPCHIISFDRFFNFTVFKFERNRLSGIIGSLDLIYHGKMGADIVPNAIFRLLCQIYDFFYPQNLVPDIINDIPKRLLLRIIIDGCHDIVRLPPPVFIPFKLAAYERTVALQRKIFVNVPDILVLNRDALNHSTRRANLRELRILNGEGHFIRDDFPSLLPVERNRVRIQK